MLLRPWDRLPADGRKFSSARACSTLPSLLRPFCRSPRLTPCVKGLGLNPGWIEVQRSLRLLLALYRAGSRRRCCDSAASLPVAQNAGALAGFQRRPASLCPDLYASAHQQDQPYGQECKLQILQLGGMGNRQRDDRAQRAPGVPIRGETATYVDFASSVSTIAKTLMDHEAETIQTRPQFTPAGGRVRRIEIPADRFSCRVWSRLHHRQRR